MGTIFFQEPRRIVEEAMRAKEEEEAAKKKANSQKVSQALSNIEKTARIVDKVKTSKVARSGLLTSDKFQFTDYTISQTDAVNVNHFINEFDTFGYSSDRRESIPCDDIVHAKPFTFELGGEIESQTVMSGRLK